MPATTFIGHFLGPDTHAARPAAGGLPNGTLYVCTTDNKIERVVAGAWVDYANLAPAGGGSAALTLISTTTLASAGTFDITSIPGTYNDLELVVVGRSTDPGGMDGVLAWFNNDSGNNYSTLYLEFASTSLAGAANEGLSNSIHPRIGQVPANAATANHFGSCEATIPGYASTTWKKHVLWRSWSSSGISSGSMLAGYGGFIWNNTAAINRIQVRGRSTANLAAGTQLRIYGRL